MCARGTRRGACCRFGEVARLTCTKVLSTARDMSALADVANAENEELSELDQLLNELDGLERQERSLHVHCIQLLREKQTKR